MVRRGEYLERAVVIPGGASLEGLHHRGPRSPALLIAPPHPTAGSMESEVIAELAWAVTRRGHPTLRFNYRGVGASQGTFTDDGAYADVLKAAHHLRACVAGEDAESLPPIAACGVGFGAAQAARLATDAPFAVSPLILISPDVGQLPVSLAHYRGELVAIRAEEGDAIALPNARLATVNGADRRFLRGLVDLGKIVAETMSAGGSLDPLASLD